VNSVSPIDFDLRQHPALAARLFIALLLLVVALAGVSPARADWRDDLGTLRIGIVSGYDGGTAVNSAEPFRLAVQEALGIPVEFYPAPDITALATAQSEGRVEYAIMPASGYAAAWANCECVEPLVVARSGDGSTGFSSLVVTSRLSGIDAPKDLAGKRIMTLGTDSIGGKAWPLFAIAKEGIALEKSGVAAIIDASGSEDAVSRFLGAEADALLGWSSFTGEPSAGYTRGTLRQLNDLSGGNLGGYKVIWRSQEFPNRTHSVRKNLAADAKSALRELLLGLFDNDPVAYDAIEPLFGGGFAPASQVMYVPVVEFVSDPLRVGVLEADAPRDGQSADPAQATGGQPVLPDTQLRTGTPAQAN
jgi:phosphonate transport system substrate-binding protein